MDAMNDYAVAPWVALAVIALVIGWQCIGFPGWLRQHLKRRQH